MPSHVFRGRDRSRGRRSACGFARPFAPWRLCRGRCGGRRRNIGERRGRRRTCGRRRGWECRCGCIRAVRVRCARAAAVGVPACHPPLQLELHRLLLGGGRPQRPARPDAGRVAGHHRRLGRCRLSAPGHLRWRALPARRFARHCRLRARTRHRLGGRAHQRHGRHAGEARRHRALRGSRFGVLRRAQCRSGARHPPRAAVRPLGSGGEDDSRGGHSAPHHSDGPRRQHRCPG